MSAIAITGLLIAGLALAMPHMLPLHRATPQTATAVWLLALLLRAGLAVAIATIAAVQLADLAPVRTLLDWCWHELLPDVPGRLGFGEHPVSHAAVAVPALTLSLSVLWLGARYARDWLWLRGALRRALGPGPLGTTVVDEDGILLAATGFGASRIIVSRRALGELDDGELRAALLHEMGHIRRRHRILLAAGSLLAALAVLIPGTRAAVQGLRFQLERDADAYAVRRLRDPLSLATAICKVAVDPAPAGLASLGGAGGVSLRLRELIEGAQVRTVAAEWGARVLAVTLAAVTICLGAASSAWAIHAEDGHPSAGSHACSHT